GVWVSVIRQLAPGLSTAPWQALRVIAKSPANSPSRTAVVIVSASLVPWLVTVSVAGPLGVSRSWSPKASGPGWAMALCRAGPVPPVMAIRVSGLTGRLPPETVIVAVRFPVAVGANFTETTHESPSCRTVPRQVSPGSRVKSVVGAIVTVLIGAGPNPSTVTVLVSKAWSPTPTVPKSIGVPFSAGVNSRTKTSSVSLVSFATRSSAWESKATNRPSAETAGRWLCPSPSHVLFGGGPAGAAAGGGGDEGGADDGGGVITQGNRTLGETS